MSRPEPDDYLVYIHPEDLFDSVISTGMVIREFPGNSLPLYEFIVDKQAEELIFGMCETMATAINMIHPGWAGRRDDEQEG